MALEFTISTPFENGSTKWPNVTIVTSVTSPNIGVVIGLAMLFFIIGVVGVVGNSLVIFAVLLNRKMRTSMTNLLITNLAIADLVILLLGIPETILFMTNKGWTLDKMACKSNRFILVTALYGSVLTLIALCIERYVAIIHPIKAHILCNKRRITAVLGCLWPFAFGAGLPTLFFNDVRILPGKEDPYCTIMFPYNHETFYKVFKYVESVLFYFIPLGIQLSLYLLISKHLFTGSDRLHRRVTIRSANGSSIERHSEALKLRRGVIKMLMMCVIVYFVSYSPNQILLIVETIRPATFHENFSYIVFTMIVANINSAANPVLYSIFSQNFRKCFKLILCRCLRSRHSPEIRRALHLTHGNGGTKSSGNSMAGLAFTEV
ncbi:neuropeptide receptor 15-like [Mytilus galloprovincialis]